MIKKFAAIGLSAALVLSPLAAFAQADTTAPAAGAAAPAADAGTMAKPMKAKHHAASKKPMHKSMKKPMAAPAAPAAPEAPKS